MDISALYKCFTECGKVTTDSRNCPGGFYVHSSERGNIQWKCIRASGAGKRFASMP